MKIEDYSCNSLDVGIFYINCVGSRRLICCCKLGNLIHKDQPSAASMLCSMMEVRAEGTIYSHHDMCGKLIIYQRPDMNVTEINYQVDEMKHSPQDNNALV